MGTQNSADTSGMVELDDGATADTEWVVAKCLLSANDRTSALLEQLLLDAYTDDAEADPASQVEHFDRALDELRRAQEELELARSNAQQRRRK